MVTEAAIQLIFEGPALQNGTMGVKELASTLSAVGELCQQANRVLNHDTADVQVLVQSDFTRGSFGIDLKILQDLGSQLDAIIKVQNIQDATELAKNLGFITTVGGGLIKLLKWLRGKEPEKVLPQANGNQVIVNNNNTFEVPKEVFELYADAKVRQELAKLMKPLEKPGIEVLEIKDQTNPVPTRIEKQEVPFFRSDIGIPKSDLLDENEAIVHLEIARLSFKGEKNKWTLSDGTNNYNVQIEDRDFFSKIDRRDISFSKGDILKVRVRTETRKTNEGLKTERRVIEVLEVIPGQKQYSLPEPGKRPRRKIDLE